MRFVCLGYRDEARWAAMSEEERAGFLEECMAYGDELHRGGHVLGGEALKGGPEAVTIRRRDGQVAVTDGPFAETKEQLGGLLIFEARDMSHAVELMSRHPGIRGGPFEVYPVHAQIRDILDARRSGKG
jgi:hypothetical protein